jgi:hypothetical protein
MKFDNPENIFIINIINFFLLENSNSKKLFVMISIHHYLVFVYPEIKYVDKKNQSLQANALLNKYK